MRQDEAQKCFSLTAGHAGCDLPATRRRPIKHGRLNSLGGLPPDICAAVLAMRVAVVSQKTCECCCNVQKAVKCCNDDGSLNTRAIVHRYFTEAVEDCERL
jgi:hypothetical protein